MTAQTSAPVELGRVGVWHFGFAREPAQATAEAAAEIEELGYGALLYPEAFGLKDCFAVGAQLLASTRRIAVATGIANIWARDAITMANAARTLSEASPGRFLLGVGVSHSELVRPHGSDYRRPLSTMRAYLDRMDSAPYLGEAGESRVPRMLGALRPKMLELAGERALGAHPYFVPVEHTARARELLGPDKLVITEQAVLLERDPAAARASAREHCDFYLALENYRNNLLTLGYTDDELADGGSDRVVDDIVAWGDVEVVRDRVRAHLEAGADHVCIQPLAPEGTGFPLAQLRELAPALVDL